MSIPEIPEQAPARYQAPAQAAPTNFMEALSQGINQVQQQKKQNLQDDQDRQALLAQRRQLQEKNTIAAAQNKSQMIGQQLLTDPSKASDPQYVDLIKKTYEDMGMPAPITKGADGKETVNVDTWKKTWDQTDDNFKKWFATLPKDQRAAVAKGYSGIPPEMLTTDAFVDAKSQAALIRAQVAGTHEQDWKGIMEGNQAISKERADAMANMDYHRVAEIDAQTTDYIQKASNIAEQTREMPLKLAQAGQRIQNELTRIKQTGGRSGSAFAQLKVLNSEANSSLRLFNDADSKYQQLLTGYNTAIHNGAKPDDPSMIQMKQLLDTQRERRNSAQTIYDQASNFLQGEATGLATGGTLSSVTGRPTSVVGSKLGDPIGAGGIDDSASPLGPAKGVAEGTTGSYKGKNIIAHGGQWYEQP